MDGRQIGANDLSGGVLARYFEGPAAGAGGDVEDVAVLGNGGVVEGAVHSHDEEMVLEIWNF